MTSGPEDAAAADASSWESIVAALEEDIRRSEEAARERAAAAPVADALAPSEVRLPDPVELPAMPPFSAMPAVPTEVVERIRQLQVRIEILTRQLQAEIATVRPALTSLNGPRNRLATSYELPTQPHFFDTVA